MTVSKEQVLAALAEVRTPGGTALAKTPVLSDIVTNDGKVFFSITVDASAVKLWEPVRKAAEAAVRAIPGVQSALVALTAERAAGPPRPPRRGRPAAGAAAAGAGQTRRASGRQCAERDPGRRCGDRGRLRQGRCR
jgi:ATP-binding protein involved in chromosome partitioning